MADLTLRVNGENNAGPALKSAATGLSDVGDAADKLKTKSKDAALASEGLWKEMTKGATAANLYAKAVSVTVDFIKDSYKAFQDQERADRQLQAAAGDLTSAFQAQASVMQSSLGVSDDMVERMQTMLLTFGVAPAEIEKTTKALLDYSAHAGVDAVQATEELLSSAKTGRAAFKELNLSVDNTHGSMETLTSTVNALAGRIGGAADREADTLEGSVRKASEALGELKESFGKSMSEFAEKTHVVDFATSAFEKLKVSVDGGGLSMASFATVLGVGLGPLGLLAGFIKGTDDAATSMEEAKKTAESLAGVGVVTPMAPDRRILAQAEAEAKAKKEHEKWAAAEKKRLEAQKRIDADRFANAESANEYATGLQSKFDEITRKAREDFEKEEEKEFTEARAKHIKDFTDSKEEEMRLMVKGLNEQAAIIKKQDDQWASAGAAIGGAFAGALSNAIADLASGGEADVGETIGSILASVLAVAGSVLGNIVAPGVGGAIGGALGGLAGAGIKAATRRKRHDGGYAGDFPRYHAGTWVGSDEEAAILQNGERVLSRPEVSAMGGPRGVERAVNGGGGGMTINVSTFDGSTAREYFEKQGGRALQNTLRTGRGVLPGLLGGR